MSTRKLQRPPKSRRRLERRCAFCDRQIPEDHEIFAIGGKARPGIDLDPHRGQIIEITVLTLGRKVPMIVPGSGSPAAREGHDLCFMTCSQSCASGLKVALGQEIKWGDAILEKPADS